MADPMQLSTPEGKGKEPADLQSPADSEQTLPGESAQFQAGTQLAQPKMPSAPVAPTPARICANLQRRLEELKNAQQDPAQMQAAFEAMSQAYTRIVGLEYQMSNIQPAIEHHIRPVADQMSAQLERAAHTSRASHG